MSKRSFVAGALVLALGVTGSAMAATKAPAASAAKQKVYKVAVFEEPTTNNVVDAYGPAASTWTFAPLLPQYGALYGVALPRYDLAPSLAAGDPTPFKQEGSNWTSIIPIRKDLTWSDGTKFTADDVVFTYNSIFKMDPDKLGGNWTGVFPKDSDDKYMFVKAEKVDSTHVKFYLTGKLGLAQWQYGLLQGIILNQKHWEPVFKKAFDSKDPVKTLYEYKDDKPVALAGFVGGRWEKGAFYEIKKDAKSVFPSETTTFLASGVKISNSKTGYVYQTPGGSGKATSTVKTGPQVDSTLYRLYGSQNAAYLALQKGEVNYVLNPTGMQKGTLEQLKGNSKITVINNAQNGFRYLGFNMSRAPMSDKAFRQAIATVIDSDWLAKNVLQGAINPLSSVVPPGNAYWYNPDIKIWGKGMDEYDRVKEAVKILKAAGYSWDKEPQIVKARGGFAVDGGEGLKGPDGKPVPRVTLLAPTAGYDPMRSSYALWVERWVNDLGIDLKAKLSDFNVIVEKQNAGDYDMLILGWGLSTFPSHLYEFFHSKSGWNQVHYNNPEFDKVAEDFMAATDMASARKLAFKAQEILAEDVPYVVLYTNPMNEAYRNDQVKYEYTKLLDGLQSVYGAPSAAAVVQ